MTTSIQPTTLVGMKKLVDHTLSSLGLEAIVNAGILKDDNHNFDYDGSDEDNNSRQGKEIEEDDEEEDDMIKEDGNFNDSANKSYNVLGQTVQDPSIRIQDIPPAGYQGNSNLKRKNNASTDDGFSQDAQKTKNATLDRKSKSSEKQILILSQSREAMLQIFTWQIINGYFLRELEQQQQIVEARQRNFNAKKNAMMKDMKNIAQYQEQQAQQTQDRDSALGAINEMLSNGAKTEEAQQLMILKQKLQERLREQLLAMEKAMEEEDENENEDGKEGNSDDNPKGEN